MRKELEKYEDAVYKVAVQRGESMKGFVKYECPDCGSVEILEQNGSGQRFIYCNSCHTCKWFSSYKTSKEKDK